MSVRARRVSLRSSYTIATSAKYSLAIRSSSIYFRATTEVNSMSYTDFRRILIMAGAMPKPLVHESETLEHVDGHVDDRSQLDCIVGLTRDDNTSTSTDSSTVQRPSISRNQMPSQRDNLHKPFCGRVRAGAMDKNPTTKQSI